MKYELIRQVSQQEPYPVRSLCQAFRVSVSGYYGWLRSPHSRREQADGEWLCLIRSLFLAHRQRLGSPRIHALLRQQGYRISRKRVARLMRQAGLVARHKGSFRRPRTTDSVHSLPVAPNRLNRCFEAERPNEKWVSDLTYLRTSEGWLYLAVIVDVYSRRAVGWSVGEERSSSLTEAALRMAWRHRRPDTAQTSLLHHSDRGCQYASGAYQSRLQAYGIQASMSGVGCVYDHALMESFFATLKTELGDTFASRWEAECALLDYLEGYYNRCRPHSALGYLSPIAYEQKLEEDRGEK